MLFTCPYCKQNVEAGPQFAGLTVNCPHQNCGKQFLIPPDSFTAPQTAEPVWSQNTPADICDWCGIPSYDIRHTYSAQQIQTAVRAGLRPPKHLLKVTEYFGIEPKDEDALVKDWIRQTMSDATDWVVCATCVPYVEPFLAQGSSPPPSPLFEGELSFPPGVRENAARLMQLNSGDENYRLLGQRVLAEKWADAFQYAVAAALQTRKNVATKYVGACFLKWAESCLASRSVDSKTREYLCCALRCLNIAIDYGERDWDVYQFRGTAHLYFAQLDGDHNALARAENDYHTSMQINPTDAIRRNLARVSDVRNRLA